jgi:hypothetical protein
MLDQPNRPSAARAAAVNVTVFACAASAGIHAGIAPEHLREAPRLGVAFVLTVVVLAVIGAALAIRPERTVCMVAALVLGGLIVAYAATRTTGIPLLSPDPEGVDPVGIAAVVFELVGMTSALWLARRFSGPLHPTHRGGRPRFIPPTAAVGRVTPPPTAVGRVTPIPTAAVGRDSFRRYHDEQHVAR